MTSMAEPPQDVGARADASTEAIPTVGAVTGPARSGTHLRELIAKAKPGDVAIIDVLDLREADAEALAAAGVVAVVNAQRTASGRQPAAGARTLLRAGLAVIDGAGPAVLALRDGTMLTLSADRVMRGAAVIATGTALTQERVVAADTAALDHLKVQVAVFGSHAIERLEREGQLFFEGAGLPSLGIDVAGRIVLVVADSPTTAADLSALRLFINDRRPIVISEGGAVDACLAAHLRPAVIIGGIESAPESALAQARVIVPEGEQGVGSRLEAMGVGYDVAHVALGSADLAALAAHHAGAEVIVVAGRRQGAVDVLSAEPDVGIGAFLTALVTRRSTTDASVIAATYRHRHSLLFVWTVLVLAFATLAIALWSIDDVRAWVQDAWTAVTGWFGSTA
jgi:uncharacterized membrane-anchored protein